MRRALALFIAAATAVAVDLWPWKKMHRCWEGRESSLMSLSNEVKPIKPFENFLQKDWVS